MRAIWHHHGVMNSGPMNRGHRSQAILNSVTGQFIWSQVTGDEHLVMYIQYTLKIMTPFCWGLFVPSASLTCCSCSSPAEGIRYCLPLVRDTGVPFASSPRLSRPLARLCAWDVVPFAPIRVPECLLLRATHSYSASRTGCLALSWPSVRVRFLILGDILSYLHTALSFPKLSPKSWPRRSAADLVSY